MHRTLLGAIALITAGTAFAQTAVDPKDASAEQVVTKPLTDLNIKKDDIPPVLLAARQNPYELAGLRGCPAIAAEVTRLNAALGEDFDVVADGRRGPGVGNIAKSLVGSLIPFGGVIRELSGANENQRQWQLALYAGTARRSFLKGYGQQKGCKYPARAATLKDIAAAQAATKPAPDSPAGAKAKKPR
jgi:hypothetical protein